MYIYSNFLKQASIYIQKAKENNNYLKNKSYYYEHIH